MAFWLLKSEPFSNLHPGEQMSLKSMSNSIIEKNIIKEVLDRKADLVCYFDYQNILV